MPVKDILLPLDVPSKSDRRLVELENQVQCLMEAQIAPKPPIQVNKISSSCEIRSDSHDTQYFMENPEQDFVDYASSRNTGVGVGISTDDEEDGEWLEFEQPLNLVDTSEESPYESLIKKMSGRKYIANAYIDLDSPMNVMSLSYYNEIRNQELKFKGLNFVGIGFDMHVFVRNMSYVMDFTILENVEANIGPSLSKVAFGKPFVEPTSEGHDLFASRIILSDDDVRRGCESA
ncbi:hypothetical protein Tco_0298937 [Tanacetum coccineum]